MHELRSSSKLRPTMDAEAPTIQERLLQALEHYDSDTRQTRVERIEWLSLYCSELPAIMGRAETLHLLTEARKTFIHGHFIATLLIAMACIEHCIVEDLTLLGHIQKSPSFSQAITIATDHKIYPPDWLKRAKRLSLRRNPFAHLKDDGHRHALGTRVLEEKQHPHTIVEADAKDAIELMYNIFISTLRDPDV